MAMEPQRKYFGGRHEQTRGWFFTFEDNRKRGRLRILVGENLSGGKDAVPLRERENWKSSVDNFDVNDCVFLAFDGTWKHAKEMLQAYSLFLSKFSIQACLNFDAGTNGGTIFDSDLTLRKEPYGGCMSTMEAVARCLRLLEPNGIEIESILIKVLRAMVKFQASFLKPMKPRPKLSIQAKEDREKMTESSEFPA